MERTEAEAICKQNAAAHPDRAVAQWRPKEQEDGSWTVVRVNLPPAEPTTPEQRADERPPTADDPRASIFQNIPPYGAGF
jgi:uncharacterized iron-regulated membrane protein